MISSFGYGTLLAYKSAIGTIAFSEIFGVSSVFLLLYSTPNLPIQKRFNLFDSISEKVIFDNKKCK